MRMSTSVGLFSENTLIPLRQLILLGLASPPPPAKLVEPPLLAHCVVWFTLA
jgi:hypothetical protein